MVSANDQRPDLDRQVARVTEWVTGQGLTVARVVREDGRRLIVADPGETTDDLVRDMIEVLTSMCARLYGRRGARHRAMRAVTAAKNAEMDAAA